MISQLAAMNLYTVISASVVLLLSVYLLPHFNLPRQWLNLGLRSSKESAADLIVKNGVIFTSDESLLFADSMAVRNGRILHIGNYTSIEDLSGDKTKVLDLEGKLVVPGFIDSHVHFMFGGLQMLRVDLHSVNRKDELVRRIREAVRNLKEGSWLLGGGWNNDLWGGELPSASWIDEITPHNPVWLISMDGHMGLANSVTLKIAGIKEDSEDPIGGTIMKSNNGEPTGLVIDAAMKLVFPWIPDVTADERREALVAASNLALSRGVTAVVDMGRYVPGASTEHSWQDLTDLYQWADSLGKLKTRVCLFFPMETWSRLHDLITKAGLVLSDWIYLGGVKAFTDGSLGSNSALFYEPYVEEPHNYGLQVTDFESLLNMTTAADRVGLQVSIHAIGDKANDMVLDLYTSVASANGERDRRFRIEHAQHLKPGTAARFGEQGIIASVQPDHLLDDADSARKKLGMDRAEKGSYQFGSLLAGNARLALGSDWPVADINPLGAVKTAMKRIPPGWETSWIPSECLSLKDALIAHTISAAQACFMDNEIGSLSPGKLADFVVLSTTSWDHFEKEGTASIEATYTAGLQAYP